MDTNTAMAFIDKAVQKTKSNNLNWSILSSTFKLKPLHTGQEVLKDELSDYVLLPSLSYFSEYKSGYLLLLIFSDDTRIVSPLNNRCVLSLRVQEETSKLAIEISNSQFDPIDAAELIRLYNLVELNSTDMSPVSSLVNDFLNS